MMQTQWLGLYKEIFGAPKTIISDEGSHFANKFFAKLMSRYGIKHMIGLAYHPRSNGKAEISIGR